MIKPEYVYSLARKNLVSDYQHGNGCVLCTASARISVGSYLIFLDLMFWINLAINFSGDSHVGQTACFP
jgi:hypothetical protein